MKQTNGAASAPDPGRPDTATATADVLTAMEALPDAATADIAKAALNALSDGETAGVVKTAVNTLPDAAKADFAAAAMKALPDTERANAATAAVDALPEGAQDDLIERFAPDQHVTNDIWRWIVKTFSIVLVGAMVALVAAVIVSFWQQVDTAMVQILLTIFTTTAGILAGFISGRASTARLRRA